MRVDIKPLYDFLQLNMPWPLAVNPGRGMGKTHNGIEVAAAFAFSKQVPALFVVPNRSELRRLEEKWAQYKGQVKFTTYANLEQFTVGRQFSCVMLDEPSLMIKYGAHALAAEIIRNKRCPVIIFGE